MNTTQIGTLLWQKQSKCNAEFFALTYGALVAELLRDIEDPVAITTELDRMGHSIGVRCIEEVLAKVSSQQQSSLSATSMYKTFPDTSDLIQTAFRMFMGVPTETKAISDTSYTISFTDNPLAIFVELPPSLTTTTTTTTTPLDATTTSTTKPALEYSQLLVGMIRGMLEMLQYDVSCRFMNTTMSSTGGGKNETNEILVELKQILQDGAGDDYHEE